MGSDDGQTTGAAKANECGECESKISKGKEQHEDTTASTTGSVQVFAIHVSWQSGGEEAKETGG